MRSIEEMAEQIRAAMESADLGAIGAMLAPDARWGAPEQEVPTCRNAQEILAWYEMARDNGTRADVTEINVRGNNIIVGLALHATANKRRAATSMRWQVLSVERGMICEIRGYETRGDAETYATSGVSAWK